MMTNMKLSLIFNFAYITHIIIQVLIVIKLNNIINILAKVTNDNIKKLRNKI